MGFNDKEEVTEWKSLVPAHYHEFGKVFAKDTFDQVPEHKPWDHKIDLKPDAPDKI